MTHTRVGKPRSRNWVSAIVAALGRVCCLQTSTRTIIPTCACSTPESHPPAARNGFSRSSSGDARHADRQPRSPAALALLQAVNSNGNSGRVLQEKSAEQSRADRNGLLRLGRKLHGFRLLPNLAIAQLECRDQRSALND